MRPAAAVLVAGICVASLYSVNWSVKNLFLTPDQQGRLLLARGDFAAAAEQFQDPMQQGTAFYRNSDFKAAAAAFGRGDSVEAVYNRATALLMSGLYDAAIAGYEHALSLRPGWREAEENLALARARKERMAAPDDDAGGTGGKLGADEIIFDKRVARVADDEQETVQSDEQMSDTAMQAMWLRRVQTRPADFLRVKFSYQKMRDEERGGKK